eukprot:jgi/Bigna1/70151/fgenesh1_pg.11_\
MSVMMRLLMEGRLVRWGATTSSRSWLQGRRPCDSWSINAHQRTHTSTAGDAAAPTERIAVYGRGSSSNTQKVLWMIRHLGLEYDLTLASARLGPGSDFLVAETKGEPYGVVNTPSFSEINPHRTIPTILCGREEPGSSGSLPSPSSSSFGLWESHSIVRYLARRHQPAMLTGQGKGERGGGGGEAAAAEEEAKRSMWMDWVLSNFHSVNHDLIDSVARTQDVTVASERIASAHDGYVERFLIVEKEMEQGRSIFYCGGSEEKGEEAVHSSLSVADIPLGAELNRWSLCWHNLRKKQGLELPVPDLPLLTTYYHSLLQLPAYRAEVFDAEAAHHGLNVPGAGEDILTLAGQSRE